MVGNLFSNDSDISMVPLASNLVRLEPIFVKSVCKREFRSYSMVCNYKHSLKQLDRQWTP